MSSLTFNSPEQVQGALWFLPVWLVSSGLFAGCVWFWTRGCPLCRKDNVKLPVCAFACILIGLAGVFLNHEEAARSLPTICRAALLVVPVYHRLAECSSFSPISAAAARSGSAA
ncbi:MAG: hypothetical protein ACLT76_01245 [Clostridium fessum]